MTKNDTRAIAAKKERISAADLPHHKHIVGVQNQVIQLNEMLANLDSQRTKKLGAIEEWTRFLGEHYQLAQGDRVEPDGTIVRRTAEQPAAEVQAAGEA